MLKNILKISILTSLLGGMTLFSPPKAQAINIDGHEYQDINTMIESKDDMLAERPFLITALNPTNSTIRVLFQDEAASRWMMWPGEETTEKDVLRDLHLFWWENGPDLGGDFYDVSDPRFHIIVEHIDESGEDWFPANEEVELSISEDAFAGLKSYPAYYFVRSEMSTMLSSEQHFEDCLSDIGEDEGFECRAHMNEWGEILYLKAEVKIDTPKSSEETSSKEADSETSSTTNTTDLSSDENMEPPMVDTANLDTTTSTISVIDTLASNTEMIDTNTTTILVKITSHNSPASTSEISTSALRVPENEQNEQNGQNESEKTTVLSAESGVEVPLAAGKEEKHDFPWWIVVFVFSGITLILWWFIPVGKRRKDEKD